MNDLIERLRELGDYCTDEAFDGNREFIQKVVVVDKAVAALEQFQWRPIEDMPDEMKDGRNILVYGPHNTKGHYISDTPWFDGRWEIVWKSGYGAPTHWMPLPTPPEKEET